MSLQISNPSPLARGTRRQTGAVLGIARFIPTRAGNTQARPLPSAGGSVHPHSRGEHNITKEEFGADLGSSPLARGTHHAIGGLSRGCRFIPTRAGNTLCLFGVHRFPPVHPHSRGEHPSFQLRRHGKFGSSPLARGTQPRPCGFRRKFRFIPTRAGNTNRSRSPLSQTSVHPHSRGEHKASAANGFSGIGSSPLARGTPRLRSLPRWSGSVHPHSRGEHIDHPLHRLLNLGSSPLARGTHVRAWPAPARRRFIPTRAGNTN